ncbi:hypothetical protein [Nostoc sp. ATCC 53789]|jgi:hypothetical protein|uniref:hypothetical protein n=1 Tax=Nostoc sp. ATCC 53789 TaxID=76335 RepID=UPI000DECC679|nr:hypothetical protein [Nostoc sp. ATCC 53789]QHG21193.1 hypothetical protein GJB62_35685 [Nostoc sp. ATCC 53789]RCJ16551.1 hypothetical protein A6V25_30995 [Nostoc sp. ATCC 53789]
MAVNKNKSRSVLGANPLAKGVFNKTEVETQSTEEIINNQESRFLIKGDREAVNLRLPIELNDWLNDLLKKGKRKHGAKVPKEVWVQAALELFKAMPVNWEEIDSEENLQSALLNLETRIKNIENI